MSLNSRGGKDCACRPQGSLVVGRTIARVRALNRGELEGFLDAYDVTVLELDDGTVLVAGQDDQFFGLGWLYVRDAAKGHWSILTPPKDAA